MTCPSGGKSGQCSSVTERWVHRVNVRTVCVRLNRVPKVGVGTHMGGHGAVKK